MKIAFQRALLSSVFVPAAAIAASAADLPVRKAPLAPPAVMAAMWDGAYLGVNVGYGWSNNNRVDTLGWPNPTNPGGLGFGVNPALAPLLATFSPSLGSAGGFLAGGQAGYNKQFGSFLIGWESDLQIFGTGTRQGGNVGAAFDAVVGATLASTGGVTKKTGWLATSRLRAGYTIMPNLLLYATGGVATGRVQATTGVAQSYAPTPFFFAPITGGAGFGSYSATRVGYTVGGGAEWMFAPNWSVKAEYLYYDLGRAFYGVSPVISTLSLQSTTPASSARFNGHMARLGLNYHWDWTSVFPAPAAAPQNIVWNGFYAGLNLGYAWTAGSNVTNGAAPGPTGFAAVPSPSITSATLASFALPVGSVGGFSGGGQIGTNRRLGSFVVGWETDMQFFGGGARRATGVSSLLDPLTGVNISQMATVSRSIDWLSTSRARLGYLVMPDLLLYGTAGFATGGVKASTAIVQTMPATFAVAPTPLSGGGAYSQARVGYTLGGGVEWAFAPNWSVKAEYLYYDLGRANFSGSVVGVLGAALVATNPVGQAFSVSSTRFNGNLVRAGVNYHWNWDPAPAVVAKY